MCQSTETLISSVFSRPLSIQSWDWFSGFGPDREASQHPPNSVYFLPLETGPNMKSVSAPGY